MMALCRAKHRFGENIKEMSEVSQALRKTSRGQLQYDYYGLRNGGIKHTLDECTSSPTIGVQFIVCKRCQHEVSEKDVNDNKAEADATRQVKHSERQTSNEVKNEEDKTGGDGDTLAVSPKGNQEELVIKYVESAWDHKAKVQAKARRESLEKHSQMLTQRVETQLIELNMRKEKEARRSHQKIEAISIERSEAVKERQQKLRESHKNHAKMLNDRMREAEKHKLQQEEEAKKREEIAKQRLESLHKMQQELKTSKDRVEQMYQSCQHPEYLPDSGRKVIDLMKNIWNKVEGILEEAKASGCTENHLQVVLDLCTKARNAVEFITTMVDAANKKGKEVTAAKQQQAADAAAAAATAASTAATKTASPAQPVTTAPTPAVNSPVQNPNVIICVQPNAFKEYERLQAQLKQVQEAYAPLLANPQMKKIKFDLQKAINIPVNAISPTSGAHLRDKLQRVFNLLQGQPVEVSGKRVSANQHPAGIPFCKDLFAKKIVKQGDEQVSSNFESAFAIAAVAVGVWSHCPDVGELMLAHFHQRCPYIVPYYLPKQESQSIEDYHKSLGYVYEGGVCEKQDKFLKRMSGIMRLYASFLVSSPPARGAQAPHPHGLEHGWVWLTRTLNIEPRPYITATMLFDFLQVTGHALFKNYGKQFIKLLNIICTEYLPKIRKNSPAGAGGSVSRLEIFLEDCIKKRDIGPPEGLLSPNFWFT